MFNPNPIAFTVFGLSINWYGILIAGAVMLAIWLSGRAAKRCGYDPDIIVDCTLLMVPAGVIGGRLYYVAFEWEQYRGNLMRILDIRSGGLAIYGAVILGMVAVLVFSKWRKIPFLKMIDFIIPSLILAQGIGRWGNFFNQEAFGNVVTNPSLQFFPYAVYIQALQQWHQATFFYESIWCIGMFFVLYAYQRKNQKDGNVLALYLVVYGFERMIVEGLRSDSLYVGSIRISQLLSALMFLAAGIYLLYPVLNRFAGRLAGGKAAAPIAAAQSPAEPVEQPLCVQDETIKEEAAPHNPAQAQQVEPVQTGEAAQASSAADGGFEVAQSLLDELDDLKKNKEQAQ